MKLTTDPELPTLLQHHTRQDAILTVLLGEWWHRTELGREQLPFRVVSDDGPYWMIYDVDEKPICTFQVLGGVTTLNWIRSINDLLTFDQIGTVLYGQRQSIQQAHRINVSGGDGISIGPAPAEDESISDTLR